MKNTGTFLLLMMSLFVIHTNVASAASTTTSTTATTTEAMVASTTVPVATTTATTTTVQDQVAVEKRVREYFADVPAMIQIARCESNFRQFADSGMPFRGGTGGGMIGVFQLYEKVHATAVRDLGFNLATLEGNIGYARHLYTESGTTPWASCEPTPTLYTDNTALRIELMTKLIELLQQLLAMKLAGK
jgi:hypothetical protein